MANLESLGSRDLNVRTNQFGAHDHTFIDPALHYDILDSCRSTGNAVIAVNVPNTVAKYLQAQLMLVFIVL